MSNGAWFKATEPAATPEPPTPSTDDARQQLETIRSHIAKFLPDAMPPEKLALIAAEANLMAALTIAKGKR